MKKSKKRVFVVVLFLIAIAITLFVMFRGAYLEQMEMGEQYLSVFWKNFQYKTISLIVTFLFIIILTLREKRLRKKLQTPKKE